MKVNGKEITKEVLAKAMQCDTPDDRWQRLPEMSFARHVSGTKDGSRLVCYPAFLKLKWK